MFHLNKSIITGSSTILATFPIIIPTIAFWAHPSDLIILLYIFEIIKKGTETASIERYCDVYSSVSSLAPTR